MTDLKLRYTAPSGPVQLPTDVLNVRAGQAIVMCECLKCGWLSQPFSFAARTVHLDARSHFLGLQVAGKIKSWRCKRSPEAGTR